MLVGDPNDGYLLPARFILIEIGPPNLLKDYPDLAGFSVSGRGMEGATSAVREEGLAGKLAIVVNELTSDSRSALNDGVVTMVLATPTGALCSELIALMTRAG